jgi:multiple sugar transport system permease protein
MATTALYAFLASWTEFLGALTFFDTSRPVHPAGVPGELAARGVGQIDDGFLAGGSVVVMIPCVILFVALQRYYVAGLSAGR